MNAVKITRKTLAREAADRWVAVYGEDGGGFGSDKVEVLRQLRALGANPRPDDVDAVIGNRSWTEVPECDGCGAVRQRSVVRVGEPPDYDSSTCYLCKQCVAEVAAMYATGASA